MDHIPYFDGHSDAISRCTYQGWSLREHEGHLDLVRLGQFEKAAQVFALFANAARFPAGVLWGECQKQHEVFLRQMAENADLAVQCRTGAEIEAAHASGRAAALLSIEGAELIDCDPDKLETAAAWGVKLVNVTWNHRNALSGTNVDAQDQGLTDRGRAFCREAAGLGILPDVSHLSDPGFWDLAEMDLGPLVATHSDSRALCGHPRNLTDDMFRAVRDSGGVAGINLCDEFVGGKASLDDLLRHIDHFMELGGEKTVSLGGDWDGCTLACGWQGVQDLPILWDALEKRGYGRPLLEDIFYNNWLRVLG